MDSKRRLFYRSITVNKTPKEKYLNRSQETPAKHRNKMVRRIDFEDDDDVALRRRPLTRSQTKKVPDESSTVELSKTKEFSKPQIKKQSCYNKHDNDSNNAATTSTLQLKKTELTYEDRNAEKYGNSSSVPTVPSLELNKTDLTDNDSIAIKDNDRNSVVSMSSFKLKKTDLTDDDGNNAKNEEPTYASLTNVVLVSQDLSKNTQFQNMCKSPTRLEKPLDSNTILMGTIATEYSVQSKQSTPEPSNFSLIQVEAVIHQADTGSDVISQPEEDLILKNNDFDKNEEILKNIEYTDDIENALYEQVNRNFNHVRFSDPGNYLQNVSNEQTTQTTKKNQSDSDIFMELKNSSAMNSNTKVGLFKEEEKLKNIISPKSQKLLETDSENNEITVIETVEINEQEISNEDDFYVVPLRHANTEDFKEIYNPKSDLFEEHIMNEDTFMTPVKQPIINNISDETEKINVIVENRSVYSSPIRSIGNICPLKRSDRKENSIIKDSEIPKKILKKKDFFNNYREITKENTIPHKNKIKILDIKVIKPAKPQNNENDVTNFQHAENLIQNIKPIESDKTPKKKKHEYEKQFFDFLSDEEAFSWSSSSWVGSSEIDSTDTESETKKKSKNTKKTKKKQKKNQTLDTAEEPIDLRKKKKRINTKIERQSKKNKGEAYKTKKGKYIPQKYVKINPCSPENCSHECYNITEEKRLRVYNFYWSLSSQRKKDWLVSNTKRHAVVRKRTKQDSSRREYSYKYFINEGEGRREVCLKFLLSTIDVKQRYVNYTIRNAGFGLGKEDLRGHAAPVNKTSEELLADVRGYISNLPAVPSHYCRKNSTRCYLPREFKNLTNLYQIYKKAKCYDEKPFVGEKVFRNIFTKEFNIAFHVPRKDKCIKCLKYENKTISEEEYAAHLKDKEETSERFKQHQNVNEKDKSTLCVSFDLQKVLNTPCSSSLLLFYYRKISVFNLTFYESGTRDGFCFTWSEIEGKRGANEVCTILQKYVDIVDRRGSIKHLLLYSDCCPGQNRNKIVLACLHKILQNCENITTIQVNYLLSGHTYMPVDSMHAVIERSIKNTEIWTPSQWPMVFCMARKTPRPYNVNVLTHKDFLAWDATLGKYFKNISGKISKLRIVTMKKSNPEKIYVKFSMSTVAEEEEISVLKTKKPDPKQAYKASLPISIKKHADLMKMCSMRAIPECYHEEYKKIQKSNDVNDVLQDTDIEDDTNN